MRNILISAACVALLSLASRQAAAQEEGGGRSNTAFGIGAQSMLRGPGGIAATFDIGLIHIDGIFYMVNTDGGGLFANGGDSFGLGGRVFYSVHQTAASDLSLGGGLGITLRDQGPQDDTLISLEGGAKMRAFIVSNVALTAFLGLSIVLDDNDGGDDEDGFVIGGQQLGSFSSLGLTSGFGFTYYFH